MARTRKALLTAVFSYAQFVLSMASTLVLLPFILSTLGARNYGLWLTTGEVLAYLGMTDLGVFAVLPWMIAIAHGRGDQAVIRQMLANAVVVGLVVGVLIAGGGVGVWISSSSWLGLSEQDKATLSGPLAVSLLGLALHFPFLIFQSFVVSQQDALFYGFVQIGQLVVSVGLTWKLLAWGWGFYALSTAAVASAAFNLILCLVRSLWLAPELFWHWPAPSWHGVRFLLREGTGSWLASWGVRLLAASNGLVLTTLGHAEWVPIYVAMTKVPQFLQQLCRTILDSALVGLAQLYGEGRPQRVREVIHCLLFVYLFLAGGAACLILALNPSFLHWWLGKAMFGGTFLNGLVAASFLVSALTHSVVTPVGAIGRRLEIGISTIFNGVAYVLLALWFGSYWGMLALPVALSLSCMAISVSVAIYLQGRVFQITPQMIFFDWLLPWSLRAAPAVAVSGLIGYFLPSAPLWQVLALLIPIGGLYLLLMRPALSALPLPDALRSRLMMLRLLRQSDPPDRKTCEPEIEGMVPVE